ncbi:MAG: hypothetical protein ACO1SX_26085 [Actinomycetota bacterium]
MPSLAVDLWPNDLGSTAEITPLVILRDQATALGHKTQQIVEGEVRTRPLNPEMLEHEFFLRVPALGDSRFLLLIVQQPTIELYPVTVQAPRQQLEQQCGDQGQFQDTLRQVFWSGETRSVVERLISQAKVAA